jgi:hypothetical protein
VSLLNAFLLQGFAIDDRPGQLQCHGEFRLQADKFVGECDLRCTSLANSFYLTSPEANVRFIRSVSLVELFGMSACVSTNDVICSRSRWG